MENNSTVMKLLGDLIRDGDNVLAKGNEDERKAYYKRSCSDLLRIKAGSRQIYLALEDRKNELEAKKGVVDKLKLSYENLLYKQAYLQREIRACKDLATPNLSEIESELQKTLATHDYSDRLEEVNQRALEMLEQERQARVETEQILDQVKAKQDERLKRLDRKRKFLDELPGKIETISVLAKEMEVQFAAVNAE